MKTAFLSFVAMIALTATANAETNLRCNDIISFKQKLECASTNSTGTKISKSVSSSLARFPAASPRSHRPRTTHRHRPRTTHRHRPLDNTPSTPDNTPSTPSTPDNTPSTPSTPDNQPSTPDDNCSPSKPDNDKPSKPGNDKPSKPDNNPCGGNCGVGVGNGGGNGTGNEGNGQGPKNK